MDWGSLVTRRLSSVLAVLFAGVILTAGPVRGEEGEAAAEAPAEPPVAAETAAPRATVLDEMIITATRSEARIFDLPYAADVVDRRTIKQRDYRTTPLALRDIPGIMVQQTAHGHGSPYIRGFTSFRNLFLIDGIRLNNSVFRPGPNQYWNTVDPLSIDRMEVVKGPSSVLYGSDAIGGTVHAITRSPYTYGEGFSYGGRGYYRVSSAENSHVGRGEVSLGIDAHTGLLLGGTGKHFGNVEGGDDVGHQGNTGYDEYDVDFKVEHFFDEDTRIVAAHQRVRQNNVPRTHKTVFAESFAGTTVGNELQRDLDQERELTYVQFHAENREGFINAARASLSWHVQREVRDRLRTSGRDMQGFSVGTIGFWAQFESSTPIGELTYGLEYYHDRVNSFRSGSTIQGPVADDATYDLLGVYVQDEIEITDRLDLTIGGRFTYAAVDADSVEDPNTGNQFTISEDWMAAVGNARLDYELIREKLNLFGGVAQGFRAPNLSDLTRFDSARSNEFEIPAPGLDPEYYITGEVGVKARFERATAQVSYFYTDISDQILRFPTGNVDDNGTPADPTDDLFEVTKANVGEGQVYGIELQGDYEVLPGWTVFGYASYIEGEVTNFPEAGQPAREEYLSRLAPLSGGIGLRYDDPNERFWAETIVRLADDADKLSERDKGDTQRIPPGGTPSYVVWSVSAGWQIHDNVELIGGIENITDEDYRIHGSGQNMPGRNFYLGVDMTF